MSPICAYVQWKIAHLTVVGSPPKVGSWPALHLSRCAECRRVAAEYEAIAHALSCETAPRGVLGLCSPGNLQSREFLRASSSSVPRWQVGATALASLVLLALVLWRGISGREYGHIGVVPRFAPPSTVAHVLRTPFREADARARIGTGSSAPAERVRARRHKRTYRAPSPRPRARQRTGITRVAGTSQAPMRVASKQWGDLTPGSATIADAQAWEGLGAFYEEKGDYAAARWAYDQAYACSPRADLMLSIGRASEGAGDIPSAIAAYACVLGPGRSDDDTRMKGS